MARTTKKSKAQVNKQIWDKANSSYRQRWQTTVKKDTTFILTNN